ncbi:hypothetical protein [Knoellia sp. LjRoot47]|uniref:hypothetical protein n=1 Tax=Knoellia sp. LjRoot47 TaxID=3342330 RepID=UPI003ECDA086
MTPDIDDQLRSRLRGAASGAPIDLGVPGGAVVARGRRVVVRRRVLTAAGAAAATLVVAGTIGILAPRPGDGDALPALPTPTTTPTPEITPTVTPSASVTAGPTATPTAVVTPTATPTATPTRTGEPEPSSTPTPTRSTGSKPTPAVSPTSTPTPTASEWSAPQRIGQTTFRMQLVQQGGASASGERTFAGMLESDGPRIVAHMAIESGRPDARSLFIVSEDNTVLVTTWRVADVVAESGEPVTGEAMGVFELPVPGEDWSVGFSVISMPRAVAMAAPLAPESLELRLQDGSTVTLDGDTAARPS